MDWILGFANNQFENMNATWQYFDQVVSLVSLWSNYLYDNVLTNPIFYWIIIVLLVLYVLPIHS